MKALTSYINHSSTHICLKALPPLQYIKINKVYPAIEVVGMSDAHVMVL